MTRLKRQAPHRNDSGMILGLAIVGLFLFAMAGTAIALVIAAHTKALLNRDADTEAANALSSAENVIGALVVNGNPEDACIALHTDYTDPSNPVPPPSCPTGATDWTAWMPLPGRGGCRDTSLEGCWRAKFAESTQEIEVPGRSDTSDPVLLPVWTVTVEAAARCDTLPDQNNPATEVCETVTDEAVLIYETNPLPVYPTLLYSGRFWPEGTISPTACDDGELPPSDEARDVWCGIPEQSRPAADAQVSISAAQVASTGFFVNDLPDFTCASDYCEIDPTGYDAESARTLQGLPLADLADGACSSDLGDKPAVVDWTRPSLIADDPVAALPADTPADTPGMVVASGSIHITGDISAPADEPLLIVSGCHVIIGWCVHQVPVTDPNTGEQMTENSVPQPCVDPAPSDAIPDTKQLLDVELENVIIVAAGGLWAADLSEPAIEPCPIRDDPATTDIDEGHPGYEEPTLTIIGSVITGHAGATSRLRDCDDDGEEEKIVAGYERTSELPDPSDWAEANIAWWPSREHGVWRRQGAPARVSVDAGSTADPGLTVVPATVTVTEGSTARLFAVALATQPSADVTVTVRPDPALLVVTPTLRFMPDDWDTAKYVTVNASAYQDADTIDTLITVMLTAASTDGHYDRLTEDVEVTVVDDDIPALVVDAASLTVDETGSATFTVSLATAPSDPVTVDIVSGDTSAATVTPTPLIFTPGNWATSQTVTVTGVNDDDANDETPTMTLAAVSTDSLYDGLTITVTVTVTDGDTLQPLFTAADATNYVTARDCIVATLPPALQSFYNNNPATYAGLYQNAETNCRGSVPPDIPLGEADPNSLPSPDDPQALKDAIDALAVAAGLPQSMIDAAEGG